VYLTIEVSSDLQEQVNRKNLRRALVRLTLKIRKIE